MGRPAGGARIYDFRMTDEEPDWQDMLAEQRASAAIWEARQRRRNKLAMWSLLPYAASAGAIGIGIANVASRPDMRGTLAFLAVGFAVLVALQWIVPEVTRRVIDKSP